MDIVNSIKEFKMNKSIVLATLFLGMVAYAANADNHEEAANDPKNHASDTSIEGLEKAPQGGPWDRRYRNNETRTPRPRHPP